MATISHIGNSWQANVRRAGFPSISKCFDSRTAATAWARKIEHEADVGNDIRVHRKQHQLAIHKAFDRYLRDVTPAKKGAKQERVRLMWLQKHWVSKFDMEKLQPNDVSRFRDERLLVVSPSTVQKELAAISQLYVVGIKEWGMTHLNNPVSLIRKPRVHNSRDRRASDEEINLILSHTGSDALKAALVLAIETDMRRGEICEFTSNALDYVSRTLRLADTKNGTVRYVPLSLRAMEILRSLDSDRKGPLLGIKAGSITQAFRRAFKRANLKNIRFHDLRHEATSRLFERGFNPFEVAAVSGHKSMQSLKRYTHLLASKLASRLD